MRRKIIIGLALASLLASPIAPEARVLEKAPRRAGVLSGVGFISGWKCDARNITVTIDGGATSASRYVPGARGSVPRMWLNSARFYYAGQLELTGGRGAYGRGI